MNETSFNYDIIIIGGGLAGLASSIQLAKAGYKVALFEKEHYPFHKVCGEYISMESWDYLHRLGAELHLLNLPLINKLTISSPSGHCIHSPLHPGGFGISRFKLDHLLCLKAIEAGVKVFEKTKVDRVETGNSRFQVSAGESKFYSKLVLGAWGKRSNLDIKLKRPFIESTKQSKNYIAVKYHINYPFDQDMVALHNFNGGYCGISSVEDGKTCLCYLTNDIALKKSGGNIRDMEEKVLMVNPYLKEIFNKAEFLYDKPLVISQVSFLPKSPVEKGIFMAGDTAGLITPLCGNGMSMALRSSDMLCKLIPGYMDDKVSRNELQTTYIREWKKEFSQRLITGRIVQANFGKPRLTELFLKVLTPFPGIVKRVVRLTHGKSF